MFTTERACPENHGLVWLPFKNHAAEMIVSDMRAVAGVCVIEVSKKRVAESRSAAFGGDLSYARLLTRT